MSDIFLFMQHGWKNIWKQKNIWLFSALPVFERLLRIYTTPSTPSLWNRLYALVGVSFLIILPFVGFVGVQYLAYCFSTGTSISIQETLFAVKKFSWRVSVFLYLGLLTLSPFICLAFVFSMDTSMQTPGFFPYKTILLLTPLLLFIGLPYFTIFEFFANDQYSTNLNFLARSSQIPSKMGVRNTQRIKLAEYQGIQISLKNAWGLFTSHFSILVTLGLIVAVILTALILSGFDIKVLSYINPLTITFSLENNMLFELINGIGQVIYTPFSSSVFVLAYLEYSGAKTPALEM